MSKIILSLLLVNPFHVVFLVVLASDFLWCSNAEVT